MIRNKSSAYIGWIKQLSLGLFNALGKINSLWFDELYLQVSSIDFLYNELAWYEAEFQLGNDFSKELKKFWKPVQLIIPQYKFSESISGFENYDILEAAYKTAKENYFKGQNRQQYDFPSIDEIISFKIDHKNELESYEYMLRKKLGIARNEEKINHEIEIKNQLIKEVIYQTESIGLWLSLKHNRNCIILPDAWEEITLKKLFNSLEETKGIKAFVDVSFNRFTNLDDLDWRIVLEFRDHPFIANFRRKMAEIQSEIENGLSLTPTELLNELEIKTLNEFFKSKFNQKIKSKSKTKYILKTAVTNVPLPIPVNPASLFFAGKEFIEMTKEEKKYGWLSFSLEYSSKHNKAN